ncbi:MAG: SixA phosphatase family protein, partial [Acidimicrobiales bacterium]
VLTSSAVRTRQTADLVLEAMGRTIPLESLHSLYGANPDTVLGYVGELDDGVTSAMVVGHNPTLYELAYELLAGSRDAEGQDAGDRSILRDHGFPTCSLAVIGFAARSWSEVGDAGGSLAGVFSPPY